VPEGLITEPMAYPFDLPVPTHHNGHQKRCNTHENKGKNQLSKVEIQAQIKTCMQSDNLSLEQTAERVGLSVITIRRISRTLKVGPYREIEPTAIKPKSSQTPYGWTRLNGTIERHPSEWKWVELAFKLHSEGMSLHKIAAHLNTRKVASKNGGTWSAKTISQTLKWNQPHLKKPSQRR
jgi:hypothetical protein